MSCPVRARFFVLGIIFFASCILGREVFALSSAGVRIRGVYFSVEVARTDEEWRKGLMFRDQLSPRSGMLFLGKTERDQAFWMKNTPISLDIIYISKAKKIVSIVKNAEPLSERPLASSGPAQHVLEILGGQAEALKFKAGDKVQFVNVK